MRVPTIKQVLVALIVSCVAATPLSTLAQGYIPLAAIPGVTDTSSLGDFLNAAFRLGIIVAGFLAVVLISYNGLVYMASGAVGSKSDAIGWIQDVLWGLALILFSVIILKVINPDILNFRLDVKPLEPTTKVKNSGFVPSTYDEIVQETVRKAEENRKAVMEKQGLTAENSTATNFVIPDVNDPNYSTVDSNRKLFEKRCDDAQGRILATAGVVRSSELARVNTSGIRQSPPTVQTYTCTQKISWP